MGIKKRMLKTYTKKMARRKKSVKRNVSLLDKKIDALMDEIGSMYKKGQKLTPKQKQMLSQWNKLFKRKQEVVTSAGLRAGDLKKEAKQRAALINSKAAKKEKARPPKFETFEEFQKKRKKKPSKYKKPSNWPEE